MEKARKNNSKKDVRIKMESGKLRDLHRFMWNMLNDLVYDLEEDRYVLNKDNGVKSFDREFYNTLCEVTETMSAKLASHRPTATI